MERPTDKYTGRAAFGENLYLMNEGSSVGEEVHIGGPYDHKGVVIKLRERPNGFNLVRGKGPKR